MSILQSGGMTDSPYDARRLHEAERQSILDAACMLAFAVGSFPDIASHVATACLAAMRVLGCSVPAHIPDWSRIPMVDADAVYRALGLSCLPCPDADTSHAEAVLRSAKRVDSVPG